MSDAMTDKRSQLDFLEPAMHINDAKRHVMVHGNRNRVTEESIKDRIASVDYLVHGITTICVIVMKNKFKVIGHSTPADAANFNSEVGKTYAYDNAFRQIWQLEGYLLCEKLHADPEHNRVNQLYEQMKTIWDKHLNSCAPESPAGRIVR